MWGKVRNTIFYEKGMEWDIRQDMEWDGKKGMEKEMEEDWVKIYRFLKHSRKQQPLRKTYREKSYRYNSSCVVVGKIHALADFATTYSKEESAWTPIVFVNYSKMLQLTITAHTVNRTGQ